MEQYNRLGEPLLGDPAPRKVGIVRALRGLGDLLVMAPALRALRAVLPRAEISLIGLPSSRPFVQRFSHYLDHFVEFPGFPGIPETPFEASRFKNWLASSPAQWFDLVLQMHGNGLVMNQFVAMLGARRTAGFHLPGFYCPDPERYMPYPGTEPEVWRLLRLMEFLGVPLQGDHLEFPLLPGDWPAAQLPDLAAPQDSYWLADGGGSKGGGQLIPRQYAVLHPGAHDPSRRWPPRHFGQVADALAARGLQVVVTGTAAEADTAAAVAESATTPVLNLAGRTTLGALAVLLSQARVLVSNDTGVSHLAAALRVPSVIVFLTSDPLRWAPQDRRLHRAVRAPSPPPSSKNGADGRDGGFYGEPHSQGCERRCLRDACRCMAPSESVTTPAVEAVLHEALALLGELSYAR